MQGLCQLFFCTSVDGIVYVKHDFGCNYIYICSHIATLDHMCFDHWLECMDGTLFTYHLHTPSTLPVSVVSNQHISPVLAVNDRMMGISLMFAPLLRFAPCCTFARRKKCGVLDEGPIVIQEKVSIING